MLSCPQCNKKLAALARRCPSCMADLDLLVDYVSHLKGGLERADNLTRAGELAPAVWAYLEVLEVDPDNTTARQKVGQVIAAVRQFDRTVPGRRWLQRLRAGVFDPDEGGFLRWLRLGIVALLLAGAFAAGYGLGLEAGGEEPTPDSTEQSVPDRPAPGKTMTGD